jgi:DNA-binding transcriptional regulator YhcF (GntR family)
MAALPQNSSYTDTIATRLQRSLATLAPASRLPSVRCLAAELDCSVGTLRQALKPLLDKGVCVAYPRSGIVYQPATVPTPSIQPRLSSVERLCAQLTQAIAAGQFRRGESLPPLKQLCAQYGLGPPTVSAAYHRLVGQGMVCKIGKQFVVGGIGAAGTGGEREVAVWVNSRADFERDMAGGYWQHLMPALEQELLRANLYLRFHDHSHASLADGRWVQQTAPAGLLVHEPDHRLWKLLVDYLDSPRSTWLGRSPRAVVTVYDKPDYLVERKDCAVFSWGNVPTVSARTLAQYCIDKEYAQVDCFFDAATMALNTFRDVFRFLSEVHHRSSVVRVKLWVRSHGALCTVAGLQRALLERWERGYLEALLSKYCPCSLERVLEGVCFYERFEQSAVSAGPSALWVFYDDGTLERALAWCRGRGVSIPGQVSLMRMGASKRALLESVSVCMEDWREIAQSFCSVFLQDLPLRRSRLGLLGARARIAQRLSSR